MICCKQCGHEFADEKELHNHLLHVHGLNSNPPSIVETIFIMVIVIVATFLSGIAFWVIK